MSFDVPIRQTAWDAVLRWALLLGAVFDIFFGIAVLVAWRWFLTLLLRDDQWLPTNPAFVMLAAVLSIGVGLMLVVTGLAPWRYHANITAAAVMRLLSSGVLVWLVCHEWLPEHILLLAAAEGLLGVLHFIYSRRTARAAAGAQ